MTELSDADLKEAYRNALLSGAREDATAIQGLIAKRREASRASTQATVEDVAKGAASGYGKALLRQIAGAMAAKIGYDPHKAMGAVDQALPSQPSTKAGEYAQRIGAGASFGPGGPVAAAAGGAGGALSQFVKDRGWGSVSEIAAWMLPSLMMGGAKAVRPGAAQRDLRTALEQFQPSERAGMYQNLREAGKLRTPLMPWQAAPEQSSIRTLGEAAAEFGESKGIQRELAKQIGKGDQAWVKGKTDPFMVPLSGQPVDPALAQQLYHAVKGVSAARKLNPRVPDSAAIEKAAGYFGGYGPGDQQAFINSLAATVAQTTPGTPAYRQAVTQLQQAAAGQIQAPPVFKPAVQNVGEVLSGKQAISSPDTAFASASQGTKMAAREAVDQAMGGVPGYTDALAKYGKVKDIAEIIAKDQKLRNANVVPTPMHEARLGAGPTVQYAGATNTAWAALPIVRNIAGRAVEKRLDRALSSKNFKELERIAAEHPQIEAIVNTAAQALRGGAVLPAADMSQFAKDYLPGGK